MDLGSILGIGGSLVGGLLGNSAAKKAAETQANIAQNQLGIEQNVATISAQLLQPTYASGFNAARALDYELGLGKRPKFGGKAPEIVEFTDAPIEAQEPQQFGAYGRGGYVPPDRSFAYPGGPQNATQFQNALAPQEPVTRYRVGDQVFGTREAAEQYANANKTGQREYQGFQETPGYQFELEQGVNAIDNSAASRGNLFSGATLKAQTAFGQGLANREYNNYLNRLTDRANAGQAAAVNQANVGSNFAAGAGNALANYGNAASAGYIGGANAINTGIGNAIGVFNYQNQLANNNNKSNAGIFGSIPFGSQGTVY